MGGAHLVDDLGDGVAFVEAGGAESVGGVAVAGQINEQDVDGALLKHGEPGASTGAGVGKSVQEDNQMAIGGRVPHERGAEAEGFGHIGGVKLDGFEGETEVAGVCSAKGKEGF